MLCITNTLIKVVRILAINIFDVCYQNNHCHCYYPCKLHTGAINYFYFHEPLLMILLGFNFGRLLLKLGFTGFKHGLCQHFVNTTELSFSVALHLQVRCL